MNISNIINKTDFIKKCDTASFLFTGGTAILVCLSFYITYETHKLTKENYKLIKDNHKLIKENREIIKLVMNDINKMCSYEKIEKIYNTEADENKNLEVIITEPKSPEFIVVPNNDLYKDSRENTDTKKLFKTENDYLDMFEDYNDIPNKKENDYMLYKFLHLFIFKPSF